ncbi:dynamin-binding protein-like [Artemia franciscana]|uniref:Dynamin-binding protein n=1 Tax=Artemia franciscana TaxID=6661 RepID=A0AA88HFF2_ARTSF|nr:hypothetical protein QYM36_013863 [Artemia franciscana]
MQLATVIYPFTANTDEEISLQKGSSVIVKQEVDKYWCYGFVCGCDKEGKLPKANISLVNINCDIDQKAFVAIYDYDSGVNGDLVLKSGNIIFGTEKLDESWWYGNSNAKSGLFPVNYTVEVEVTKKAKVLGKKAVVVQSLQPQLESELHLVKHDIVTITGEPMTGWYSGIIDGKTGVFPCECVNITDIVSDPPSSLIKNEIDEFSVCDTSMQHRTSAELYCNMYSEDIEGVDGMQCQIDTVLSKNMHFNNVQAVNDWVFNNPASNNQRYCNVDLFGTCDNRIPIEDPIEVPTESILHDCATRCEETDVNFFKDEYFMANPQHLASVCYTEQKPIHAIALYDFVPESENELALQANQEVYVLKDLGNGWTDGLINGCRGIFPSTYIKIYEHFHKENDRNYIGPSEISNCITKKKDSSLGRAFGQTKNKESNKPPRPFTWQLVTPADQSIKVDPKVIYEGLAHPIIAKTDAKEVGMRHSFSDLVDVKTTDANLNCSLFDWKQISKVPPIPPRKFEVANAELPFHGTVDNSSGFCYQETNMKDNLYKISSKSSSPFYYTQKETYETNNYQFFPNLPVIAAKGELFQGYTVRSENLTVDVEEVDCKNIQSACSTTSSSYPSSEERIYMGGMKHALAPHDTEKSIQLKKVPSRPAPPCPDVPKKKCADLLVKYCLSTINELVLTEKEYLKDMRLAISAFELDKPDVFTQNGCDIIKLFGNVDDVIALSDTIVRRLEKYDESIKDVTVIADCFIDLKDRVESVFMVYCNNYDSVHSALCDYEDIVAVKCEFERRISILKEQVICFNMDSILIKPVQRVMRYQLLLGKIVKFFPEDWHGREKMMQAYQVMVKIISDINETKRRREVLKKYFDETEDISKKLSKVNLHSMSKKSMRMATKVSMSLKMPIIQDSRYIELVNSYETLVEAVSNLQSTIEGIHSSLNTIFNQQLIISESIASLHDKKHQLKEIDVYCNVQRLLRMKCWGEFDSSVHDKVFEPLTELNSLFVMPSKLITKRQNKFLDLMSATQKLEKNKDLTKARVIKEEYSSSKSTFEALNSQLLKELPIFIEQGFIVYCSCLHSWMTLRQKLLSSCNVVFLENAPERSATSISEKFYQRYLEALEKLQGISIISLTALGAKSSPCSKRKEEDNFFLLSKYKADDLFIVSKAFEPKNEFEIKLGLGALVAVIKRCDPTGNSDCWLVDTGTKKGFLPCCVLEPKTSPSNMETILLTLADGKCYYKPNSEAFTNNKLSGKSGSPIYEQVEDDLHPDLLGLQFPIYEEIPDTDFSDYYIVLYNFQARNETELTVFAGESVQIINFCDLSGNNDWYMAVNSEGKKGYIPSSYLKKKC